MIDTVCLLIPKNKITYTSGGLNWDSYSKTWQYSKNIRNPNKEEKETGDYYPRITSYQRRFSQEANVRIEFSAPKLMYKNNLEELEDKDFPELIETLKLRLETMGILIDKEVLETASVSSVHFSKNIELKNGYRVSYLISEINKVNLKKNFDFTKIKFINDGQGIYAHTNSHEFVIYDKIADLGKYKSRAIDKDQTKYQKLLTSKISNDKKLIEIIRFEVRLNKKKKMNEIFKELHCKENPKFNEIFKEKLSQEVLINYWEKIIKERNLGTFLIRMKNIEMLQSLIRENNKIKSKRSIYLVGLYSLLNEDNGARKLRDILSKTSNDRTWYRILNDMKILNVINEKSGLRDWVVEIDRELKNYKPYKLKNLQCKLL